MPVLAIIVGILLILFGGGCTLIMGGIVVTDPASFVNDFGDLVSILLPLGILPLVVGNFLTRWGIKADRQRRKAGPKDTKTGSS
jgi:hypothetical protein